jgi:DNA helicase II / ATP-dependent DNA helicase PcrA
MSTQTRAKRPAAYVPPTPESLLSGLNPEQADVVQHHLGALLVAAVAGTGKTTALVRRIAFLYVARGVSPKRVLAVTFSKKAAEEMTIRLARLLPGEVSSDARVGTFHSLAYQFLREERPDLRVNQPGGWFLDVTDSKYAIVVKDALGFKGMKWDNADLTVVSQFIGLCKARCALPRAPEARTVAEEYYAASPCQQRNVVLLLEAYERAEALRIERRLLTFDDLLVGMWDALRSDERCRARWGARWDFVMQDEAQDENLVQREIAAMLAEPHGNYMIVGDPAQAIYGFRGADPTGILTFAERYSARVVHLHRNYRCGDAIVNVANGSLAAMPRETHLGTRITAERGVAGEVLLTGHHNADAEAEAVVQEMTERHADGVAWKDIVVLYRTNAQSRALEEQCLGNRVPYVVIGGTNFYDRKEVKDILAYLRLAAGRGTFDDVRRSINAPFRFLGKAFVEKVEEAGLRASSRREGALDWTAVVRDLATNGGGLYDKQRTSAREWCTIVDAMGRQIAEGRSAMAADPITAQERDPVTGESPCPKPSTLIEGLLQDTGYVAWLTRDEGSESPENNRVSNIRELVRASERFNTVDGLLDYIDETLEAARRAKAGEDGVVDRVTMMSIHRSKGLEWPVVYLVGANEKILPHARCEREDEERRLFYVACTRARDVLRVSFVQVAAVGARVLELNPSRFCREAGLVSTQVDTTVEEQVA